MRRQLRTWIGGVSNACDPRFHSKGWQNRSSCFWGRMLAAFGFAVFLCFFGFAFRHAKGTLPPLSAPKNKEAGGPTLFFVQADLGPPAERVVAFAFSHDGFRARPPAPFYRLAGPATWDARSIGREARGLSWRVSQWRPARIRSGGTRSGCEVRQRGQSSLCMRRLFSVLRGYCPYKPHVGAFVGEDGIGCRPARG
jgi:hypothetical protein